MAWGLREDAWSAADTEQLKALWSAGISATEIGRQMNRSKNGVVGKVHRLKLESRPSPIKQGGRAPRKSRRRGTACPTPSLPRVAPQSRPAVDAPAPPVALQPVYLGRIQPCCFVLRSEGKRHWYCDEPSKPGKSLCPDHHAVCVRAYVRGRKAPVDDRLIARGRLQAAIL